MKTKVKRSAIESVIKSIDNFWNAVVSNAQQMKSESSQMGSVWQDAQYTQFDGFIHEVVGELGKNLDTLQDFSQFLTSILPMFDEE